MAGGGQRLSWGPHDHQVPAMGLSGVHSRRWASHEQLLPRRTMSWNLHREGSSRPVVPSWSSKRLRRQTSFNRYHSPLRDSELDVHDPWQPTLCSWVTDEANPKGAAGPATYKAKEGSRLHWDFNHHWDALRSSPLVLNVSQESKLPYKVS